MRFLDPTAVFRNFLMNAYAGGTNRAERSALMPPQPNDILTPEGEAEFYANRIFPLLTTPWKVFLILNIGEHTIRFGSLKLCLQAVSRVTRSAFTHGILSHPHGAQPSADSAGIGGMGRAIAARLLFYIRREPPRLPAERTPYEHQRIFTNAEADRLRVILKSRSHQRNFGLLFASKLQQAGKAYS